MNIGIKTYDYSPEFEAFKGIADFIEVMAIEGRDYSGFKKLGIPIVIHAQHQGFGVNIADKTLVDRNKRSLDFAIELADMLNAKKIIVHSGELNDDNCSIENSFNFLKQYDDKRILIENLSHKPFLCTTPGELKYLAGKLKLGICFDINHAIVKAQEMNQDIYSLFDGFLKLNPKHYHIGGQILEGKTHLTFSKSNIDLKKIFSLLPKNIDITLEVSWDIKEMKDDLVFIRKVVSENF